jgi:hypothetical protein
MLPAIFGFQYAVVRLRVQTAIAAAVPVATHARRPQRPMREYEVGLPDDKERKTAWASATRAPFEALRVLTSPSSRPLLLIRAPLNTALGGCDSELCCGTSSSLRTVTSYPPFVPFSPTQPDKSTLRQVHRPRLTLFCAARKGLPRRGTTDTRFVFRSEFVLASIHRAIAARLNRHCPPTLKAGMSCRCARVYAVLSATLRSRATSGRVRISSIFTVDPYQSAAEVAGIWKNSPELSKH